MARQGVLSVLGNLMIEFVGEHQRLLGARLMKKNV